jgi:hypothetical protein
MESMRSLSTTPQPQERKLAIDSGITKVRRKPSPSGDLMFSLQLTVSLIPAAMTMMEDRNCALQRTVKELAKWKDFKSIINDEDKMEYRSACDALLSISCPSWRPHMVEFYDNDGPTLIEVCDPGS